MGSICKASRDSWSSSVHKSASSPRRHARFKKAKEKFRAAREPTLANPAVGSMILKLFLVLRGAGFISGMLFFRQGFLSFSEVLIARLKAMKYLLNMINLCCSRVADNERFDACEHNLRCSEFKLYKQ